MKIIALQLALLLLCFAHAGCDPDDPSPQGWQEAFDAQSVGFLLSVWGPSDSDDLYAVGGRPDLGLVMRRRAGVWGPVELGVTPPLLNWTYGFGSDDVFVVGNAGTILHFDGSTWSQQDTPTTENLWGAWGSSPSAVWAVGGAGQPGSEATILFYDGASWSKVDLPPLERPNVSGFFKVWGSGPDDVYVVGQRGALLHFDGAAWSEVSLGLTDDLIAVWGTDADHVVVVGGRSNGVAASWDGTTWTPRRLAPLPGLNGVWFGEDLTVQVVGVEGTTATLTFPDLEPTTDYQDTRLDLHAIFGESVDSLTTVGGSFWRNGEPYEGIALCKGCP